MGETAIDEATFDEYLDEMREHYTADKVRSLLSVKRLSLLMTLPSTIS